MSKLKTFLFLAILFLPATANAYFLKDFLKSISNVSYQAGSIMKSKNANLSINQSYTACKVLMLNEYNPMVERKIKMSYAQKQLLSTFAPAEVTYCFMGYLKTKPSIVNSATNKAYFSGMALYKKKPKLNSKNSYIACQNAVVGIDDLLAKKHNTPIYKKFLYYVSPAQDTYCWVGYLDAAGTSIKK